MYPTFLTIIFLLLCYASYTDIKERRVSNKVLLIIGFLVVVTDTLRIYTGNLTLNNLFISMILVIGLALAMFFVFKMGGADAKTVILIGLLYPNFLFIIIWLLIASVIGAVCVLLLDDWKKRGVPFLLPMTISLLILVIFDHYSIIG